MEHIEGLIVDVIYHNEENFFSVLRIEKENGDIITATGTIPFVKPGFFLKLDGSWIINPKYGAQFSAKRAIPAKNTSEKSILLFLSSGALKGIGKEISKRIFKLFKEKTIDIISNNPDRLLEIKGIGKKNLVRIKESWKDQKDSIDSLVYLTGLKLSVTMTHKLIKNLGQKNVISIIEENPYILSDLVDGIGFVRADAIAREIGISQTSEYRMKAAFKYILSEDNKLGNVCMPEDRFLMKASELLNLKKNIFTNTLDETIRTGKIITEEVQGKTYLYNFRYFRYENNVAKKILCLIRSNQKKILNFDSTEKNLQIVLSNINKSRISIITGGPGTGKTSLIKKIIENLKGEILLAAPTGRAAKRLEETSNYEAKTIHRLLEYNPGTGKFNKNVENTIDNSIIIIDESSMIDIYLASCLLEAVGERTHIVFVGDANQLPPVGPGLFFKDMLKIDEIPVTELTEIFRQKSGSQIIDAAYKILRGKCPVFGNNPQGEIFFIECNEPERIQNILVKLVTERIPKFLKSDSLELVQVITPVNKGALGTIELNKILAECLNPGKKFRPDTGDKVIQMKNNYRKEIFNGDVGVVTGKEEGKLNVNFTYKRVELTDEEQNDLALGYAITVHKAQGSEYPVVVIILHAQHYIMLKRSLIYTAFTRGKEMVVLIGNKKAFYIALNNDKPMKRYSLLKYRIKKNLAGEK